MLILNVMLLNRVVSFMKIAFCKYLTGPFTSVETKYLLKHHGLFGMAEDSEIEFKLALCVSVERIS